MPEKKHEFTLTEIRAGALVLVAAAVVLGFFAVIKGYRVPEKSTSYYASFTNTLGLKPGAEVRFGGMLAGRVADIAIDPEDQSQIRVTVAVQPDTPVNEESIASIETLSLTAERHLEISSGKPEAARLSPGAKLKSVTKSGGFIDLPDMNGLVSGGEDIIGDLRKLLGVQEAEKTEADGGEELPSVTKITSDVRKLLGISEAETKAEETGGELPSVTVLTQDLRDFLGVEAAKKAEAAGTAEFTSLSDITGNVQGLLKKYDPELEKLIKGLGPITDNANRLLDQLNAVIADNRGNIDATMKNAGELLEKLNRELDTLMSSIKATLANAEGLTGDLADLLEANRPTIEDMLDDLAGTMENLNAFMQILKNQPQSILWGKPAEGRKSK